MTTDWKGDYTIVNGIIVNPGKFEGQPAYALNVWDWFMDGDTGEVFYDCNLYTISEEECEQLHLKDDTYALSLYVDDSGFVYVTELTEAQYIAYHEER